MEPWSWAINTSLIKVVTIVTIMLPLSLLRNIAMLEKVRPRIEGLDLDVLYLTLFPSPSFIPRFPLSLSLPLSHTLPPHLSLQFSALAVLFVIIIVLFTVVKAVTYYCSV